MVSTLMAPSPATRTYARRRANHTNSNTLPIPSSTRYKDDSSLVVFESKDAGSAVRSSSPLRPPSWESIKVQSFPRFGEGQDIDYTPTKDSYGADSVPRITSDQIDSDDMSLANLNCKDQLRSDDQDNTVGDTSSSPAGLLPVLDSSPSAKIAAVFRKYEGNASSSIGLEELADLPSSPLQTKDGGEQREIVQQLRQKATAALDDEGKVVYGREDLVKNTTGMLFATPVPNLQPSQLTHNSEQDTDSAMTQLVNEVPESVKQRNVHLFLSKKSSSSNSSTPNISGESKKSDDSPESNSNGSEIQVAATPIANSGSDSSFKRAEHIASLPDMIITSDDEQQPEASPEEEVSLHMPKNRRSRNNVLDSSDPKNSQNILATPIRDGVVIPDSILRNKPPARIAARQRGHNEDDKLKDDTNEEEDVPIDQNMLSKLSSPPPTSGRRKRNDDKAAKDARKKQRLSMIESQNEILRNETSEVQSDPVEEEPVERNVEVENKINGVWFRTGTMMFAANYTIRTEQVLSQTDGKKRVSFADDQRFEEEVIVYGDGTYTPVPLRPYYYKLDLRVGDEVKTTEEKKHLFIVKELMKVENYELGEGIPDIRSADAYSHAKLKCTSSSSTELTVRIGSLYMTNGQWVKYLSKRTLDDETGQKADLLGEIYNMDVALNKNVKNQERKASPITLSSSVNINGIFSKCVFTASAFEDEKEKNLLEELIISNGGRVLSQGFRELFNVQWKTNQLKWSEGKELVFGCVLAKCHSRTPKYLEALALGWPCLSWRYIYDCIEKKKFLHNWNDYLLAAGESEVLDGSPISCNISEFYRRWFKDWNLKQQFESRILIFGSLESSIYLIDSKNSNNSDEVKTLTFLLLMIGVNKIEIVAQANQVPSSGVALYTREQIGLKATPSQDIMDKLEKGQLENRLMYNRNWLLQCIINRRIV